MLEVTEISEGGGAQPSGLKQSTNDNILLLDGEELKGAKQNRAQYTIL